MNSYMSESSVSQISRLVDIIQKLMHDYFKTSEIAEKIYQISWITSDKLSSWTEQLWYLEMIHQLLFSEKCSCDFKHEVLEHILFLLDHNFWQQQWL